MSLAGTSGVLVGLFALFGVVSLFAAACCAAGLLLYGPQTFMSLLSQLSPTYYRNESALAVEEFRTKLATFRAKVEQLQEYSVDYFNTFSQADWHSIYANMKCLNSAEAQLLILMETRRYRDAFDLASFLLDRLAPEDAKQVASHFQQYSALNHWISDTRRQLAHLTADLSESAQQNKEAGVQRSRERKATMMMLEEVRKILD